MPVQGVAEAVLTAATAVGPFDVAAVLQEQRGAPYPNTFVLNVLATALNRRCQYLGRERLAGDAGIAPKQLYNLLFGYTKEPLTDIKVLHQRVWRLNRKLAAIGLRIWAGHSGDAYTLEYIPND